MKEEGQSVCFIVLYLPDNQCSAHVIFRPEALVVEVGPGGVADTHASRCAGCRIIFYHELVSDVTQAHSALVMILILFAIHFQYLEFIIGQELNV